MLILADDMFFFVQPSTPRFPFLEELRPEWAFSFFFLLQLLSHLFPFPLIFRDHLRTVCVVMGTPFLDQFFFYWV